jgi:hypothetical protein
VAVNRITLVAALALAALATSLPALADGGAPVSGVVAALSASGVVVKDARHTVTCAVKSTSPSLAGYAVGDRVEVKCRGAARHLVLARIRHLTAAATGSHEAEPVKFGGTVTALSATSISLQDGGRTLTCTLGDASQSTSDLKVGAHAKVVCLNGVLVSWTAVTAGDAGHAEPPKPAVTTTAGTVTAVSATSLTLHNAEHGDLTCTVSSSSPSVGGVHVGDVVRVACKDGVLSVLAPTIALPTPTPTPLPEPSSLTTAGGTLTALSSTSLTVHNDEHGDVSCSITDASPRLGDYHVGDRVKLACAAGVLKLIAKL